ncbi:hypothetical protein GGS26DRAFT_394328 [Hypomontagnella submonticulosa]|nr:hypothetical protein GGS26DRAFT_394328 [Hypomontagnella submonticulosa]
MSDSHFMFGSNKDPILPTVADWQRFFEISEAFIHGQEGELSFDRTCHYIFGKDAKSFFGYLKVPKKQIALEGARNCLRRGPRQRHLFTPNRRPL